MAAREPFPDVELMLEHYLDPIGYVGTHLPIDYKDQLQQPADFLTTVNRIGGGEDANGTVDHPRVRIVVYALRNATKPRAAHDGASEVRTRLLALPAPIPGQGLLDSATTESGPTNSPFGDPAIAAVAQIFRISTRR